MEKINFAFFGTPDVASKTLEILKKNGYVPSIIITSPDRLSGRGMHLSQTPVSIWAEENKMPCLKPEKINAEFIEEFNKLNIDISIVVAYGKILPENLINTPKLGTINIHYSLLPKYRGASPVESALLNGDKITGVSIQQMAFKLDSGPIIAEETVSIGIDDNKVELREKLINTGAQLLSKVLPSIIKREIDPKPQDEPRATYCGKIKKEDGEIDIKGNAKENYNKYRAFSGWPGVYFFINKNGKQTRVKITEAKYKDNSFIIERVVLEGKKETDYSEFMKSNPI